MLAALATLVRLAPLLSLLISIGGAGLVSAGAVWAGKDWWFTHVSAPQIRAAQRAADEAEFEAAVERARREFAVRVDRAVAAIREEAERQRLEAEAEHEEQLQLLEERIHEYEAEMDGDGRTCSLTERDLQFLGGLRVDPAAVGRGARQGAPGDRNPAGGAGGVR